MTAARTGAAAAVVAALAWSAFLLDVRLGPPGFTTHGFVSELSTPGAPGAAVFRSGDLLAGLALLVLAAVLARTPCAARRTPVAAGLVAATGVAAVLDAAVGMSCAGAAPGACADDARTLGGMLATLADVHTLSAVLAFVGTGAAPVLLGSALVRAGRPCWGWAGVGFGVAVALAGLADLGLLLAGADVGLLERVRTVVTSLWFAGVGALLLAPAPADRTRAAGRREGVRT